MNKVLKMISGFCAAVLLLAVVGCTADEKKSDEKLYERKINIQINLKDGKSMKAELYPDLAPETVNNFINLVEEDFYNGLIFHRVIPGFMIQGGGYAEVFYTGIANQKEAKSVKGEFSSNGVENNLKHTRGVLSMARTSAPDSATSQFFIMHEDYPSLDGQYAAFGKITEGIEVVDEIAAGKTTAMNMQLMYNGEVIKQRMTDIPETPVVIESIEILY